MSLIETNSPRHPIRRTKLRFQIEQEIRYKVAIFREGLPETGTGKSLAVSSREICFSTESALYVGLPVELSMTWPVLLDNSCPMQLRVHGCVIRSNERSAVVSIERYEFRTQAVGKLPLYVVPKTQGNEQLKPSR